MPRLYEYRQAAAAQAGPFLLRTAASGTTTQITDTAWPVQSTLPQEMLLRDYWLYRPQAALEDRTRLVSGYTPAAGLLTADRPWSVPPAPGEPYELHGAAPPEVWHSLINETLRDCFLVVEFEVQPTEGAIRHSLGTVAPWLTHPAWVRQVGWREATENRQEIDPFRRVVRGEAIVQDGAVILEHPHQVFSASQRLMVRAVKPAFFHCRAQGGTYGEKAGLQNETDEALPALEWVVAGVLARYYQRQAALAPAAQLQEYRNRQAEYAALFSQYARENVVIPPLTFRPLRAWGVPW